ncbi:glycerophosphodiester phosphodiesterase [Erythrobacter sp. HKB08]|uniref:glycerophosphodiester phosphodiesterase n=1 Tax=Erythrobacter sp. HKB08 TaxID=2502843 RepID=UPI0010090308|nr:glycerophosphodiester phosphodiesterase [Erythrobacter sp. HKB08]
MGRGTVLRLVVASLVAVASLGSAPALAQPAGDFLVIAHRGASGERPEHTLAAYELAIDQGADYIEPDLVVTKDGVLVARHENEISGTTDVADREEFSARRRAKEIDGELINGWFAEDFTLAELRTLRAKERLPGIRRQNMRFDGLYQVPTLEEIVKLVRAKEAETGRRIGLYPELKHPDFLLQEEGIDTVDLLLIELRKLGVTPDDPVFIQSFEVGPLQRLDKRSDFKLVQLLEMNGGPADEPDMRYAEMVTPSGLAEIAAYADAIGVDMRLLFDEGLDPTPVIKDAKAAGLAVHAWTLRKENAFLPPALQSQGGESAVGNPEALLQMLYKLGVDGVFTDDPGRTAKALNRGAR